MENKLTTFIVQENTENVNKGIIAVRLLNEPQAIRVLTALGYAYDNKNRQFTYYINKEQYLSIKERILNETKSSSL